MVKQSRVSLQPGPVNASATSGADAPSQARSKTDETKKFPVFDGHDDFLFRLLKAPETRETMWLNGDGTGHLDLPRMRAGGFAGGFFALFSPSEDYAGFTDAMDNPSYELPLPTASKLGPSQESVLAMVGHLFWMERVSRGAFTVCRSAREVRAAMAADSIAAIMHMEGAEAIDPNLDALYAFHKMGLRSVGPVWSRPNAFGHGVPFAFPASPDIGPGLTDAGKALVKACNELKIIVDLSHLNEKGFDDVASISDAPLVATHSNAHAVTPLSRNLTDRQLAKIRETKGMVGLNFVSVFLRPDGKRSPDITFEPVLRHLDHLIDKLGEDHVGFGSDFDGATKMPDPIRDVTGLPRIIDALRDHGYSEELIAKLAHENWIRLLERAFGE
ncbi:dipeptidase [Rhizobium mongolense]|uniref:dipeptidase n=1 Tax=Rhizobium mongolense TaxID=57676 RepID=UPI003556429E